MKKVYVKCLLGFPDDSAVKNPTASVGDKEMWVQPLGQEDPLEKEMATGSSILAWIIKWTEEPGYNPWGHKESNMTEKVQKFP